MPSSKAEMCMNWTLEAEGGLVDHPEDPGGATNYGISSRAHPDVDVRELERDEARNIYYQKYWVPASCEEFSPAIALALFDLALHSGVPRASRILQGSVGARQDGDIGPRTIATVWLHMRQFGDRATACRLTEYRIGFLCGLVSNADNYESFLEGWMIRCARLIREIGSL